MTKQSGEASPLWDSLRTPVALGFATSLVLCAVAIFSAPVNRNPDETHHLQAVAYYTDHFLPPEIGDPSVRDSYSVWGISYLNYGWAEYLFLGKLTSVLNLLIANQVFAARISNLLLFALAGFYFVHKGRKDKAALLFTALLLVTPQLWYIASYVNNDVFALVISFFLAYQVASFGSSVSTYFRAAMPSYHGGILFGLFLGLQLVCKTNYWPFAAFVVLWALTNVPITSSILKRMAFVCLMAAIVVGIRIGADLYVNGETNFAGVSYVRYVLGNADSGDSKLRRYQEEIAARPYRPSVMEGDLTATDPGVKLKQKGVSLTQLFTQWKWHEFAFCSFVGVYGYMDTWGPRAYYAMMAMTYVAFTAYFFVVVLHKRRNAAATQAVLTLCGVALTVCASIAVSWTYSFQPQGRYLFPCIPIMAVLIYSNHEVIRERIVQLFVFSTFLLSIYSFLFVGLVKLRG